MTPPLPSRFSPGGARNSGSFLAAAMAIAACMASSASRATELPDAGGRGAVRVKVHTPLGPYFRPGRHFPIIIDVESSDIIRGGEISIEEGRPPTVRAWRLPGTFTFEGSSRFYCAAAAGKPELVLRGSPRGGPASEIFRSPLDSCLRPLAPGERLVVVPFGRMRPARLPPSGNVGRGITARVLAIGAAELPRRPLEYESVDLTVWEDDSISDLHPAQAEAFAAWLGGGGRSIFSGLPAIRSAVRLMFGARADAPIGDWETLRRACGLSDGNVREWADVDRTRPAVVGFRYGVGEVVLFFLTRSDPIGHSASAATDEYIRLLSFPDPPADARVRWDVFRLFDYGRMPSSLRRSGVRDIALPCLLILAGACVFFRFVRPFNRHAMTEAASIAAASALLAAAMARIFPEPGISSVPVVARVWPADGSGRLETGLTLLRSFRGREAVRIAAGRGMSLALLAERHDELASQRYVVRTGDPVSMEGIEIPANAPQLVRFGAFLRHPTAKPAQAGRLPGESLAAMEGASGWLYYDGRGSFHPGQGDPRALQWSSERISDLRSLRPAEEAGGAVFHESLAWAMSHAPPAPCIVAYRPAAAETIHFLDENSADIRAGWLFDIVELR